MNEVLYYSKLYDVYGVLLTSKQKETFEDYFFENLTIDEIASNNSVSKNSVSKMLMRIKDELKYYEDNLHFVEYRDKVKEEFCDEEEILKRLLKYDNIVL